jgi:hypothetical protein
MSNLEKHELFLYKLLDFEEWINSFGLELFYIEDIGILTSMVSLS